MLRSVPDRLRQWAHRPARVQVDIGRAQLVVASGTQAFVRELETLLVAGSSLEALAALRDSLADALAQLHGGHRVIDLTVADALARQWIFRRPQGVRQLNELDAVARLDMQRIYGDGDAAETAWHIRYDAQPFLDRWPAVALPQALVDTLSEAAATCACEIATLRPRFAASVAGQRTRVGALFRRPQPVVHVLDATDGITVGIRAQRQWLSLRTYPALNVLGIEMPALVERECRAAGIAVTDVQVDVRHWPGGRA